MMQDDANNVATTETAPTEAPAKEELILGKFKSQEDLIKSYQELEKKQSGKKEEPVEEPTEEGGDDMDLGEDPFGGELPVEDEFADEPAMEEEPMSDEGEVEVDVDRKSALIRGTIGAASVPQRTAPDEHGPRGHFDLQRLDVRWLAQI